MHRCYKAQLLAAQAFSVLHRLREHRRRVSESAGVEERVAELRTELEAAYIVARVEIRGAFKKIDRCRGVAPSPGTTTSGGEPLPRPRR